jgi:hypothetical protein
MHAGLFDVLHHSTDEHFLAIAEGIDVHLAGIVQKTVEQDRRIVGNLDRLAHVAFEVALLMDDLHCPAAEHVRGTNDQRIADFGCQAQRLGFGAGGAVGRLSEAKILQQLLESLAILGRVDHVRAGANDRYAIGFEVTRELERGLAAILDDDAKRFLDGDDFQHVLERQAARSRGDRKCRSRWIRSPDCS